MATGKEYPMEKTRFEVVRQAIDVLFRRLERVPLSDGTAELRARVRDCMRKAGEWTASPPPDRERDELMKRVLALHVELAKLERNGAQIPEEGRLAS